MAVIFTKERQKPGFTFEWEEFLLFGASALPPSPI